jgi:hypothetical protein
VAPGQPTEADRAALREALAGAAPRVGEAAQAMERTTQAVAAERFIEALGEEAQVDQQLARAQEFFFDLRQLLSVTHADESRIAEIAGSQEPEVVAGREELAPLLRELQVRNLARAERLLDLLARERDARLRELAAQPAQAAPAPGAGADAAADPLAIESERFDRAEALLALADGAMQQARAALGTEATESPEWQAVAEASAVARDHLDAIRTLFFTIVEHLKQLAQDQVDTRDATRDAIALSATEVSEDAEGEPIVRGPETRARATALAAEQAALEARAGVLADALLEQSEKQAAASDSPAAGAAAGAPEPERLRKAAEHVAAAQLSMRTAQAELAAEDRPLDPAEAEQQVAIEELADAIELLSPPPPPEQGEQEQEQQQPEESPEPEQDSEQDEQSAPEQPGGAENAEQEAREEESMGDPSQLLQGIRDREAERRRDRERAEQRQRSQPVDRDW